MTEHAQGDPATDEAQAIIAPPDRTLDERGKRCPIPVISLARAVNAMPEARILLLSDDAAAETDVPAWCALRGRVLVWTGRAPDGAGRGYLVVPATGTASD